MFYLIYDFFKKETLALCLRRVLRDYVTRNIRTLRLILAKIELGDVRFT